MQMDRPSKAQANNTLKHCPIVPEQPEEIKCENKNREMLERTAFPAARCLLVYANTRDGEKTPCFGLGSRGQRAAAAAKGSRVLAHLFVWDKHGYKTDFNLFVLLCLQYYTCCFGISEASVFPRSHALTRQSYKRVVVCW